MRRRCFFRPSCTCSILLTCLVQFAYGRRVGALKFFQIDRDTKHNRPTLFAGKHPLRFQQWSNDRKSAGYTCDQMHALAAFLFARAPVSRSIHGPPHIAQSRLRENFIGPRRASSLFYDKRDAEDRKPYCLARRKRLGSGDQSNLLFVLSLPGDLAGAEELLQRILKELPKFGDNYPDMNITTSSVHGRLGQEVLKAMLRSLGKESPVAKLSRELVDRGLVMTYAGTAQAKSEKALYLEQSGNFDGASMLWREVFDTMTNDFGILDPHTLKARNNLIRTLICLRDLQNVVDLLRAVWEARSEALGSNHVETDASRTSLILALLASGYAGDALKLVELWEARRFLSTGNEEPYAVIGRTHAWEPDVAGAFPVAGAIPLHISGSYDLEHAPLPYTIITHAQLPAIRASSAKAGFCPVVIFPGYGLHASDYDNMFPLGTPVYKLHLWDEKGLSYKPGSNLYIQWWAEKLQEVKANISKFNLPERAFFFAHSAGAKFAVAAADHHPIRTLVTYGRSPHLLYAHSERCRAKQVLCLIGEGDRFGRIARSKNFKRNAYFSWAITAATIKPMPYFGLVGNGGHMGILSEDAKQRHNDFLVAKRRKPYNEQSGDVRTLVGMVAQEFANANETHTLLSNRGRQRVLRSRDPSFFLRRPPSIR